MDLNEDGVIDDYERAYSRGEAQKGQMSSESMGTAAAMSVRSTPGPSPYILYAQIAEDFYVWVFVTVCSVRKQAFKKFMGNNPSQQQQSSGGGDMQSKLIGMAMAEAMKLFSSSGGQTTNGGGQQDVVNAAGKQIMSA